MSRSPDRTRPPAPDELRPLHLPEFRRLEPAEGIELWAAEDDQLPEVSLRVLVDAGAIAEAPGAAGSAELTGRLITEGAGTRSAVEMARWLDRIGAGFSASVGYDATLLTLHTLSDRLPEALDFLRDVVEEPRFEPAEVRRVREELADEQERDRDEPDVVADHALIRAVFGEHRYATPSAGVPESVRERDREEVASFHDARFRRGRLSVIACGDLDAGALSDGLGERFTGRNGPAAEVEVPAPGDRAGEGGRVLVVDRPGSAQAEVRLGAVGLAYGEDGFFPSLLGNAVLGGLFNSRLNMNLREEKGWTYGARSSFHYRRAAGPFVASAAVETESAGPALEEFVAEVRGMWERPPDGDELEVARNNLVLSMPRQFETVSQVTRKRATQVVYGLSDDWWESYRERVEAVGADEAVRVLRRRLAPDTLVGVVVAEAEAVVPDLEGRFDRVDVVTYP